MKIQIDIKYLIVAVASFGITYAMMTGVAQQYVHFADALNEIGVTFIASMAGIISLFAGIEKVRK